MMLPPERTGHAASADLIARRAAIAEAVAAGVWRTDNAPEELEIGGVRCLRFLPSTESRGTVLHIHGGAFRQGCPEMIGPFATALATRCGVVVICPAYRLAPEHPFPSGLNDAIRVMTALNTGGLIVSGDSAGGGIAAGLAARNSNEAPALAGLALLSPWLDLTVSAASFATNAAHDPLFSGEAAREAATLYLQGFSPDDGRASPMFAAVDNFPPTLINIGAGEVLIDDACAFFDRLRAAGVESLVEIIEGMDHVAVTRDLALPGAAQTFATVAAFVDERVRAV
ncbi:alpha/beta hydrolase [Sphingomonas sp. SUN039]|uniref:alpha/beta hydrolase n=1 Tax=Sphingomonas sp. SUN039 TaxID=2937787 RepID=UPI0021640EB3|nr:alpha/beta hydrolase [Sphingomonas sp. SUN039]UVO53632.1 alpha/beta hydrolase [Sphingomonas sp. SUN039]